MAIPKFRRSAAGVRGNGGTQTCLAQIFSAKNVLHQAQRHADSGESEAPMPVDGLAHIPTRQRRQKRADVDSHVENGEARVSPVILFLIELADHGADVGLQQSGSDHDKSKTEIEGGKPWNGHSEMARGDYDSAIQYGAALAQRCGRRSIRRAG